MKKIGNFLFNFFSCDLKGFYGQKLAVINIFFIPLIYLYLKYNFPFYYTVLIYFFCLLFFSNLSIIKISSFCMILILLCSTAFYSIYNTRNFINSLDSKTIWSDKIKIIDVISPKSKIAIINNLKFIINDKKSELNYGDVLSGDVFFESLSYTSNFFSFDYNKYLFSNKIYFSADINNIEYKYNSKNFRNTLIDKLENRFSNLEKSEDKQAGDFLCGVFFNHRNSKKIFYDNFKNLNISHFLAFSGMHLTFFLYAVNIIPDKFKFIKNLFSIIIIGFALIISGASPSILRAGFFCFLVILSNYFGRVPYFADITGLYSIFHILINPWIIFNNSFLLSVIFFTQLLIIKNLFKVSLIFFIENIILFGTVSIFSPFLNIFLTIVFPFVMLAGLCSVFSWGIIFEISLFIVKFFLLFINYLNSLNITLSPGFWGTSICIIMLSFYYIKSKKITYLITLMLIFANIYIVFFPYVLIIDTGHGNAIIVNTFLKGLVLLDSGNKRFFCHNFIENFLIFFNLKIKSHFISHFDYDHYSSSDYLAQKKLIDKIFIPENKNILKIDTDTVILENNFYKFNQGNIDFMLSRWGNGDKNENSFSYIFSFNNKWFGIFSDQSASVIRLMESRLPVKLDYFVVSHHGGKGSLDSFLVNKYSGSFYIISCGKSFSNPAEQTLDLLENKKIHITKNHGALFIDLFTGIRIPLKKQ